MKSFKLTLLAAFVFYATLALSAWAGPQVVIGTNHGDITLELNEEKAPGTVKNFVTYAKEGFYDNTVFHRVIEDFMIQGGGFELKDDGTIQQKETSDPIQNEAKNGLKNKRGKIAMARTGDPHSATAQFFINHADNTNLDFPSFDGWGYAVFGEVVEGMDVVDKIAGVTTSSKMLVVTGGRSSSMENVPEETVVIESVKVVE